MLKKLNQGQAYPSNPFLFSIISKIWIATSIESYKNLHQQIVGGQSTLGFSLDGKKEFEIKSNFEEQYAQDLEKVTIASGALLGAIALYCTVIFFKNGGVAKLLGPETSGRRKMLSFADDIMVWILLVFGGLAVLLPILLPNQELLIAIHQSGGSYLTAVSLSSLFGIRYGLFIAIGFIFVGIGGVRYFIARK